MSRTISNNKKNELKQIQGYITSEKKEQVKKLVDKIFFFRDSRKSIKDSIAIIRIYLCFLFF